MWKCEYVMVSRVECKPHLFDCQPQWVVADKITFHVSFQIDPCDVMGFIKKIYRLLFLTTKLIQSYGQREFTMTSAGTVG